MKIKFLWLAVVAIGLSLLVPAQTSAHLPGQPPFTYVNGEAAGYYPVGFASLPDLGLAQDAAPGIYVVNTDIDFSLLPSAMPYFPEEIPLYEFSWDFGDGQKVTGLEVHHQYTSTGSKVISIYSRDTRTSDPAQLLSTLFVQIAPSSDYRLPQPVFTINGMHPKDYLTDSLDAPFTKKVVLDASKSTAGSAQIASYTWDLGNRQLAKDSKVKVSYDNLFSSVLPVVRVTDSNGLYVDGSVQINNTTLPGPDGKIPNVANSDDSSAVRWPWAAGSGVALLAVILLARRFALGKR